MSRFLHVLAAWLAVHIGGQPILALSTKDFQPAPGTVECTAQQSSSHGTRVAWLFSGSYRQSPKTLSKAVNNLEVISLALGNTAEIKVFVVTSPPLNTALLYKHFADNLVGTHTLTAEETTYEAELVEAASGVSAEKKGHLLQYYKMYRGLEMIADYERQLGVCFDLVAKQRFDHELIIPRATAAQWLTRALQESDSIWHATSDYFALGSRQAMGKMLSALFTGGCAVHPVGLRINTAVLSRQGIDYAYLQDHGVYPQEIRKSSSLKRFVSDGSGTTWELDPDTVGVNCDTNGYYRPRSRRPGANCWTNRTPAEHQCYAEAEMVSTVLSHQLAFYDASKPPFNYALGAQADDWKTLYNFNGNFAKCAKGGPAVGRPRENSMDVKLFIAKSRRSVQVRVNSYNLEVAEDSRQEFFRKYVTPVLTACVADPDEVKKQVKQKLAGETASV